ncbi:NXPE family member 3-like [Saccoglossus kowalevskii]
MMNRQFSASTAGRVADYGNGTYSVFFYAPWPGIAEVIIALEFTREAITFLRNAIKTKEMIFPITAKYTNGSRSGETQCFMANEGVWSNKCEYVNTNSLGKTSLICNKLNQFSCEELKNMISYVEDLDKFAASVMRHDAHMFQSPYHNTLLEGMPMKIKITDSSIQPPRPPPCGPDMPIPITDGYWKNRYTFIPLVCRSQQWTKPEASKCLQNKLFIVSGDSTIGQLVTSFKELFNYEGLENNFVCPRIGKTADRLRILESDLLDKFGQQDCRSKELVVVLNFFYHYALWSERAYLERIYRAKLAVLRLRERCPNTKVIIKLAHPVKNRELVRSVHSSNWIFYDMNRMARYVFGGIGVLFLDPWDLVVSSTRLYKEGVHSPPPVIYQEVYLLLSYICPELVSRWSQEL